MSVQRCLPHVLSVTTLGFIMRGLSVMESGFILNTEDISQLIWPINALHMSGFSQRLMQVWTRFTEWKIPFSKEIAADILSENLNWTLVPMKFPIVSIKHRFFCLKIKLILTWGKSTVKWITSRSNFKMFHIILKTECFWWHAWVLPWWNSNSRLNGMFLIPKSMSDSYLWV